MPNVEQAVQTYYGGRPLLQRIDAALRAAGIDPEHLNHRDDFPVRFTNARTGTADGRRLNQFILARTAA